MASLHNHGVTTQPWRHYRCAGRQLQQNIDTLPQKRTMPSLQNHDVTAEPWRHHIYAGRKLQQNFNTTSQYTTMTPLEINQQTATDERRHPGTLNNNDVTTEPWRHWRCAGRPAAKSWQQISTLSCGEPNLK